MPRPLIIKVESHSATQRNKFQNSIDTQFIPSENVIKSNYEPNQFNDWEQNSEEEKDATTKSLVRKLISRYEPNSALHKYKSKSMGSLKHETSPIILRKMSKDDCFLFNNTSKFPGERLDIPHTLSKADNVLTDDNENLNININSLHIKAKYLLNNQECESWQSEVIHFLKQIAQLNFSQINHNLIEKTQGSLEKLDASEKVNIKEIKNIFELKLESPKAVSLSVSPLAAYFGLKSDESNDFSKDGEINYPSNVDLLKSKQPPSSASEDDEGTDDVFEENKIETSKDNITIKPTIMNLQGLKFFFEKRSDRNENDKGKENDKRTMDNANKVLTSPKIDVNGELEMAKRKIEELTKDIENCEDKIKSISDDDIDEGNYIKELLVHTLIQLDDLKTYGNATIVRERKKSIEFVQNCIHKLKKKLYSDG